MAEVLGEMAAEELIAAVAADIAAADAAAAAALVAGAEAAGGTAASSGFAIPASVISGAKAFAASFVLARLFAPSVNLSQGGGLAQTFLANSLSNMDPIAVIYGSRRVGASVVEIGLTATEIAADRLHRLALWGEGPISAVNVLYLDTVASTDGKWTPGAIGNIEHFLGTDAQGASATLIAYLADSSKWNANCTFAGVAYTYVNLVWNPTLFPHGRPVVTADVDGRTLYDPRTGNTTFSRNPALVIRDYLTNTRYGRGVPASMIDDLAFAEAAYHCDDLVSVPDGAGGTTTQARYTCDGVLNVDQTPLDNLKALLTSCRGFIVFSGGKYKLRIDRGAGIAGAYLSLPGVSGNHVITPDSAALDVANDIDIRMKVSVADWTPAATNTLIAKGSWTSPVNAAYAINLMPTGVLKFFIGDSASTYVNVDSTVATGFVDGTTHWIRVTRIKTSGVVTYYTSDDGITWTPLGATVVLSAGTAINNSPYDLWLGNYLDTAPSTPGSQPANGNIYVAEVRNGIDGMVVGRFDTADAPSLSATSWASNVSKETWTLTGGALKAGFALSADNIIGGWSIQLGSKRNRFNRVRARFFNKDASWQPDYAVYEDFAHRTADANQVLSQDLDLPYTRNVYTAAQVAQIEEKRSRYGTLVSLTATIAATALEVGDVVPLAHATPGWPAAGDPAEGKLFRVVEMELLSSDEVRLTLLEYSASVYSLTTPAQVTVPAATSLPDLSTVAAPGTPSVVETLYQTSPSAGFKSRATATWGTSNDVFVQRGGWYQLERSVAGAGVWTIYPQIPAPGSGTATASFAVDDVAPGIYDWRVAAFNTVGAKSAYSPTTTKEIAGLNAPPSNVTNFAAQNHAGLAKFTWDKPSTVTDLAVVQAGRIYVRWSPKTSGASWDYGSLVNPDGYPGDTSIGYGPLLAGTYMAKMWNGRAWSSTEASYVLTEALLIGLSTLSTVTESPGFAGVKSNVAAVDGGIQLDGTTLIDSMLTNIDTWSAIDSLGGVQGSGSYTFAQKMDLGSKRVARLFSSIDSIAYATDDFIDSRTDLIDNWGLFDGVVVEDAEVQLWVRTTDNDPNGGSPTWSAYERLGLVADYNFRGFDFRLDFATGSPTHNRTVTALSVTAKS